MEKTSKIYIAGHRGLAGSAILKKLKAESYTNLVTRSHGQLDLTDQKAVAVFFEQEKPEYVFLAAAKVGGIHANNTYPAEFIYQNLLIQSNIIHQSYLSGVKKLLFLGSSCIYPKHAPQPMKEEYLMTGPLEPTNSAYAVAKIAGIEMCWSYNRQYGTCFIPVMPTNLYGPKDNFDLETSHVLPALIRKFHLAKLASHGNIEAIKSDARKFGSIPADVIANLIGIAQSNGFDPSAELIPDPSIARPETRNAVVLWGTGTPRREFLYVDDLAEACIFILNSQGQDAVSHSASPTSVLYNIGVGEDLPIGKLAEIIARIIGFKGEVAFDASKPDGTPRKLLAVSRLKDLGWQAGTGLEQGIRKVYDWYLNFERSVGPSSSS